MGTIRCRHHRHCHNQFYQFHHEQQQQYGNMDYPSRWFVCLVQQQRDQPTKNTAATRSRTGAVLSSVPSMFQKDHDNVPQPSTAMEFVFHRLLTRHSWSGSGEWLVSSDTVSSDTRKRLFFFFFIFFLGRSERDCAAQLLYCPHSTGIPTTTTTTTRQ